jgi:hypothetical protein
LLGGNCITLADDISVRSNEYDLGDFIQTVSFYMASAGRDSDGHEEASITVLFNYGFAFLTSYKEHQFYARHYIGFTFEDDIPEQYNNFSFGFIVQHKDAPDINTNLYDDAIQSTIVKIQKNGKRKLDNGRF